MINLINSRRILNYNMSFPHILTYLGRTLGLSKLVSFTHEEKELFIKKGVYLEVSTKDGKMSKTYYNGAMAFVMDIQDIDDEVRAGHLDIYAAQVKVEDRTQRFNREFGLEKRLTQAS